MFISKIHLFQHIDKIDKILETILQSESYGILNLMNRLLQKSLNTWNCSKKKYNIK